MSFVRVFTFFLSIITNVMIFAESHKDFYDQDWQVNSTIQEENRFCFLSSEPVNSKGSYAKRGEPYIFITMLADNQLEISVSSGYNYKKDMAYLKIGQKTFDMTTKGSVAWSNGQDKEIIQHMLKYNSLVLEGISTKGTYSKDLYLLKGFSTSLKWMLSHCKN